MTDIVIKTKRSDPIMSCGGKDYCRVLLTATRARKTARQKDRLVFRRERPGRKWGFTVDLEPNIGSNPRTTDKRQLRIPIPSGQSPGVYKYTISYMKDPSNFVILPLDPVIIIQPSSLNSFLSILVKFVIGAVAGFSLSYFLF